MKKALFSLLLLFILTISSIAMSKEEFRGKVKLGDGQNEGSDVIVYLPDKKIGKGKRIIFWIAFEEKRNGIITNYFDYDGLGLDIMVKSEDNDDYIFSF